MKLDIEVYSNAHLHKLDCQNRPLDIQTSNSQALNNHIMISLQTETRIRTVLITQWLFFLNAAIWFFFGITSILRLANDNNLPIIVLWVITILMFGNVGAMVVTDLWLGRQSRWAFLLALAVLFINILLTFTDQVGFFDIVTALLDFVILGLLLFDRKSYF